MGSNSVSRPAVNPMANAGAANRVSEQAPNAVARQQEAAPRAPGGFRNWLRNLWHGIFGRNAVQQPPERRFPAAAGASQQPPAAGAPQQPPAADALQQPQGKRPPATIGDKIKQDPRQKVSIEQHFDNLVRMSLRSSRVDENFFGLTENFRAEHDPDHVLDDVQAPNPHVVSHAIHQEAMENPIYKGMIDNLIQKYSGMTQAQANSEFTDSSKGPDSIKTAAQDAFKTLVKEHPKNELVKQITNNISALKEKIASFDQEALTKKQADSIRKLGNLKAQQENAARAVEKKKGKWDSDRPADIYRTPGMEGTSIVPEEELERLNREIGNVEGDLASVKNLLETGVAGLEQQLAALESELQETHSS